MKRVGLVIDAHVNSSVLGKLYFKEVVWILLCLRIRYLPLAKKKCQHLLSRCSIQVVAVAVTYAANLVLLRHPDLGYQ